MRWDRDIFQYFSWLKWKDFLDELEMFNSSSWQGEMDRRWVMMMSLWWISQQSLLRKRVFVCCTDLVPAWFEINRNMVYMIAVLTAGFSTLTPAITAFALPRLSARTFGTTSGSRWRTLSVGPEPWHFRWEHKTQMVRQALPKELKWCQSLVSSAWCESRVSCFSPRSLMCVVDGIQHRKRSAMT